jgi:hypothetical protein
MFKFVALLCFSGTLLLAQPYGWRMEKPAADGLVVKTPTSPYAQGRTLEVGSGLVVTNPTGEAGNPKIELESVGGAFVRSVQGPIWDDFFGLCSTGSVGMFNWQSSSSGGQGTPENGHWGICQINSGGSVNDQASIRLPNPVDFSAGVGPYEFQFHFKTPSSVNFTKMRIGLVPASYATTTTVPPDGVWAQFANAASGCAIAENEPNWTYKVANSSTTTSEASAVSVTADTWYTVRIRGNSPGEASFSVATGTGAFSTEIGPITTNFPTTPLRPWFGVVTCESAVKPLIVDAFGYTMILDR